MLSLQHWRVICFSIPITGNCTILWLQPSCPDWKPWGNRLLYSLYYNKVSVTRQKCPVHPCMIWPPQIPYPHRLTLHQHGRGLAQPSIPKYLILTEPYRGIRWLQRRWPVGITQRTCSAPLYLLLLLQPHRSRAGHFPNAQHTTASRPCCWTVSLSLTSLLRHAPEGSSEPYTGISGMMG